MNFENTYRQAKQNAIALMKAGHISAYLCALQDLKDLQKLRTIGLSMRRTA